MTDNWLSDCHQAPVKVVGADEGTNHWECTQCGKACNAHQTDNTIDHIHISKVGGTHCLECGQQLPQSTIDSEVNELLVVHNRYIDNVWRGLSDLDNPPQTAQAIKNLIAQEAKAFGGCRNCYGKGYATVRKGTTAKGKTWDLRTHINYCSCDRGKQLQQVVAQEANKAKLEILERLSCCDYEPIGDKAEINVCNGDHLKLIEALTADKEQADG